MSAFLLQWLFRLPYPCMTREPQEEVKDVNGQENQYIDILNFT